MRKTIGGYTILREIGRGGMAIVYEVQDPAGKSYALKVLDAARSRNERSLGRFLREGQAIKRLDHPNIIKIVDVGQDGDLCFIVMELVEGPTLEDLIFELRRGRKSALSHFRPDFITLSDPVIAQEAFQRAILEALAGVALAVQQAHDAGLVHRDIKPSNILIGHNSRLILTDFGLVQDLGAETLTLTGDVLGTPLYMSPEQIAGNRQRIGPKSDIYALGATIHESLGLNSPYSATDIAVLARQIARQEPRDLAELNPNLPSSVHTIVKRAMAKRPADRYSQARSVARDIELFLQGQAIEARPPTAPERVRSFLRRNPAASWALALGALLVCVSLAIVLVVDRRSERRRVEEVGRSYDDGRDFLSQGLWAAAWRTADEIEMELEDEGQARRLRFEIEAQLRGAFSASLDAGLPGLNNAYQLRLMAQQLPGSGLDQAAMERRVGASFIALASSASPNLDETTLDVLWQALADAIPTRERLLWGEKLRDGCRVALAKLDFHSAFLLSDRAKRWGLTADNFPLETYARWDTIPFNELHDLSRDLDGPSPERVLQTLEREDLLRLPWPQSQSLLRTRLTSASFAEALSIIRLAERVGLPGLAQEFLSQARKHPQLRGELINLWAAYPDLLTQDELIGWWPDVEGSPDQLRLATALKRPNDRARTFLESRIPSADLNLLRVLAEVLGESRRDGPLQPLRDRLANMDEEERQPYLSPFIQLGGQPPWQWVEQAITAKGENWQRLRAIIEDHPDVVPLAWSQVHRDDPDSTLRHLARRSLLGRPATKGQWCRRIVLDRQEDPGFRIQAGLQLSDAEAMEILSKVDLLRTQDTVLLGLSLALDASHFVKGTRSHIKRVAALMELYRDGKDDLSKSWALHCLSQLKVPEFALLIAGDLAAFEADSTRSLLQSILGRSPQSLLLGRISQVIAKEVGPKSVAIGQDVNAARCRFLQAAGRAKEWRKVEDREAVKRTLIECAARRDLLSSTRQAAIRSLASFDLEGCWNEIQESANYDVDGRVGAAVSVLMAEQDQCQRGLHFLDQRLRPGPDAQLARAWILAKLGKFSEAVSFLELAAMGGYRANALTLEFASFPGLLKLPEFLTIWQRIGQ